MEDNFSLNLANVIFPFLLAGIVNKFGKGENHFPKEFNGYSFIGTFKNEEGIENPWIGIYKDSRGKKAIAKTWMGKFKDYEYYVLKNEIKVLGILNHVSERMKNRIPVNLKDVYLQNVIGVIEKSNYLFVLTEYVEAELVKELPDEKKFEIFLKAQEYIQFLGENLTKKERIQISGRETYEYLLIYPLILIKAIVSKPEMTIKLLRGVPIFLRSFPIMLKSNKKLVHKDLHFNNILVSGKKIFILDLQFCGFTLDLYEFVTALHYNWKYKKFCALLIKAIKKRFNHYQDFTVLFAGLCINSATHGLTDYRFSREKNENNMDFLDFSLNINQGRLV